jgi:5S rRNA maturation endonuclease (ribonuclease M5)
VEGKRDAAALRQLGFEGEVITLHSGKGIYDFCEDIISRLDKVVLLLDWDEKGESLTRQLQENLEGRSEEFSFFRETIRLICQKDIKDLEGVPILLRRLEGIAGPSRPQDKWE